MLKPNIVLDTNVVLNAFFFQEEYSNRIIPSLFKTYQWVSTPWMQQEAVRVANSYALKKYASIEKTTALSNSFKQHAVLIDDYVLSNHITNGLIRCRDTDDQIFLNLALHTKATLILTLDRDLLKLKKRAQTFGLSIIEPLKFNALKLDA
jgi:uncharacterized protein